MSSYSRQGQHRLPGITNFSFPDFAQKHPTASAGRISNTFLFLCVITKVLQNNIAASWHTLIDIKN